MTQRTRNGISACLITKDEERFLPECLSSIRPFVEEIIVLDSGSSDRTVQIAQSFGAKVHSFVWCNDFSQARNTALGHCSWPWVLVIDADEILDPRTATALRDAIASDNTLCYLVEREDHLGGGQSNTILTPRLFRNHKEIRFARPVHEDVSESLAALSVSDMKPCGVRLQHRGFLPEIFEARGKATRNINILRTRTLEVPDDLYSTWHLAAALTQPTQSAERRATYATAYALADRLPKESRTCHPYLPLVYSGHASGLVDQGELGTAQNILNLGLEAFPGNVDLLYRQGDVLRRLGHRAQAAEAFQACVGAPRASLTYSSDPATRGVLPALGLTLCAMETGRYGDASRYIQVALEHDPQNLEARCMRVRVLLITDQLKEALTSFDALATEAGTEKPVQALAGEISWLQRDPQAAMDFWRILVRGDAPTELQNDARVHLCLAALCQGDLPLALTYKHAIVSRDVSSLAMRVVLHAMSNATLTVDPAYDQGALRQYLTFWLQSINEAGQSSLLSAFMSGAAAFEATVPGISKLVVAE